MPHLIGLEGLAAGAMFMLSPPTVTIGSDAESDIALIDRAVSPLHALLTTQENGQVRVEQGDSASVVLVNDTRISQAVLAPGDLLQIGDNVFRFEA
jgi:pSer/pThr/pTyr-binding forkhead associated (FHA) protein